MKIDSSDKEAILGTPPSVSMLVKEEAARWREAASANHWEVLDLPADLESRYDQARRAASEGHARQARLHRRVASGL